MGFCIFGQLPKQIYMTVQQEFCCARIKQIQRNLPADMVQITHLLRSLIEHLALNRECLRAINEVVELLATLQNRLNRLVLRI
jgi:hypothetical protein